MTHRSLLDYLDYLGEPAESAGGPQPESYPVDQLRARLAELEARLKHAARPEPQESRPESPLSSQIESILKRRDAIAPERAERHAPEFREPVRYVERPKIERISVQAPPLAPEAAAASGDFGRFVDAVQLIAQAANRYLQQQSQNQPPVAPVRTPDPVAVPEIAALSESLKQVLGALHDVTEEFRSSAEELRRSAQETRRLPDDRHATARRLSRDDAELYRLQDDLDELRDRLASVTRRRSRNPY